MNAASLLLQKKYAAIVRDRHRHPDQPVESFCRTRGITPWCFYYWQKRLRSQPLAPVPLEAFVPVSISPHSVHRGSTPRYALQFPSGVTLGISGDFERDHVVELVGILSRAQS